MAVAHGLVPAFHPHAGSFVEFEDEIDRLVNDTSLALCLDTGHAALAGIDVAQALDKYRARLRHLHLKDIDGSVLRRALADEMTFWEALEANVFCPLGAGVVDFALVASQLDRIGYRGFATIEQDRVPGTGTPVADLRKSLEVLARAGFKDADAPLGG
jgi:inosose dehydratase